MLLDDFGAQSETYFHSHFQCKAQQHPTALNIELYVESIK